mmetsp:Transcript_35781/g.61974  ORF Transcript_35781/g.61974 Transcript_35781/m.61974 type:complete len:306 (-) Transcript_35781:220-1137(-)|eukprot:CAMPEP_0194575958 /NCGR_PEP_ID=MMETSP0292-20121207/11242_1 /TAXON_ID=39354 /ORGANISM="Heterosigma akashiwo, Strain CCMP2393" /LENGTH=305 /DNA_ID=CAMNT_0039427865 /DNA_START=207 /DNA_END=1127 /DNA_ORIENTATION=+
MIKSDPFALPLGAVARPENVWPGYSTIRSTEVSAAEDHAATLACGPVKERVVAVIRPAAGGGHGAGRELRLLAGEPRAWVGVGIGVLQLSIARYLLRWPVFSQENLLLRFIIGVGIGAAARAQQQGGGGGLGADPVAWAWAALPLLAALNAPAVLLLGRPAGEGWDRTGLLLAAALLFGHRLRLHANLDRGVAWGLLALGPRGAGAELAAGAALGARLRLALAQRPQELVDAWGRRGGHAPPAHTGRWQPGTRDYYAAALLRGSGAGAGAEAAPGPEQQWGQQQWRHRFAAAPPPPPSSLHPPQG